MDKETLLKKVHFVGRIFDEGVALSNDRKLFVVEKGEEENDDIISSKIKADFNGLEEALRTALENGEHPPVEVIDGGEYGMHLDRVGKGLTFICSKKNG